MDLDLSTDIYSFLKEKYFLSRITLDKNTRTAITFVDYQRNHYKKYGYTFYRHGKTHQEYGPAILGRDLVWVDRGYVTRANGPSVILSYGLTIKLDRWYLDEDMNPHYYYKGKNVFRYKGKGESIMAAFLSSNHLSFYDIIKAWTIKDVVLKFQTENGEYKTEDGIFMHAEFYLI